MRFRFHFSFFLAVLFVAANALANELENPRFLIPPYLHSILGKSLGVAWKPSSMSQRGDPYKLILYRGGQVVSTPPVREDAGLYRVVLPIPSCGFGKGYAYQIGVDRYPILEFPCKDEDASIRFSFLSDIHGNSRVAEQLALFAIKAGSSFLLFGGDAVTEGNRYEQWAGFFNRMHLTISQRVVFPVVGNHEYRDAPGAPAWKYFFSAGAGEAFYSFYSGPVHFILLNSAFTDDPSLEAKQLAWIEAELAKPSRWKIVVFHHPPYSVSMMNHPLYPKKEWSIIQKRFVPLFEKHNVNLVLSGHTHIFERSLKAKTHYLTSGPAGGKLGIPYAENPYKIFSSLVPTVTQFEVDASELKAVTLDSYGRVVDTLKLPPLSGLGE